MTRSVLAFLTTAAACLTILATPVRSQPTEAGNGLEITDLKSSSSCRGLCMTIDRRPTKVGEPIAGTISWSHAKPGSSLNVNLNPTVNRVGRTADVGRYGSLMKHAFTIPTESGSFRFRWKGSGFWCAPTDYSMICDERPSADIYALTAVVMDSGVSPMAVLQRRGSVNPITPPRTLAAVTVGPFRLR